MHCKGKGLVRTLLAFSVVLFSLVAAAIPGQAQTLQDNYYYPGYNAAGGNYVDLMPYVTNITLTANGTPYTAAQLTQMKAANTPLVLKAGDTVSFRFDFSLCGRVYSAGDSTLLDEAASHKVVYTHATTRLNGENVAAGATAILDDSSLVHENTTKENSFLRLDVSWLREAFPGSYSLDTVSGNVSLYAKDSYLYLYFPDGLGVHSYVDPSYFTVSFVLPNDASTSQVDIPCAGGSYYTGQTDWIFPLASPDVSSAASVGSISAYGDITVRSIWDVADAHADATVTLTYTENNQQKTTSRVLSGDTGSAVFTIRSGMSSPQLTLTLANGEEYHWNLSVSGDQKTYTYHIFDTKEVQFSMRSGETGAELPGAVSRLYRVESTGETSVEKWTTESTPHTISLTPGDYRLHCVSAPNGYAMSNDILFRVTEDGTLQLTGKVGTIEGDNTIVATDPTLILKLSKRDANGNALSGAVLALIDTHTGKEVDRWTSTDTPYCLNGKTSNGTLLIAGRYYLLREISAPSGYQLAEDVEFIFNGDGTIPGFGYRTVVMVDEQQPVKKDNADSNSSNSSGKNDNKDKTNSDSDSDIPDSNSKGNSGNSNANGNDTGGNSNANGNNTGGNSNANGNNTGSDANANANAETNTGSGTENGSDNSGVKKKTGLQQWLRRSFPWLFEAYGSSAESKAAQIFGDDTSGLSFCQRLWLFLCSLFQSPATTPDEKTPDGTDTSDAGQSSGADIADVADTADADDSGGSNASGSGASGAGYASGYLRIPTGDNFWLWVVLAAGLVSMVIAWLLYLRSARRRKAAAPARVLYKYTDSLYRDVIE